MPLIGRGYRLFLDKLFLPKAGTAWPAEVRPDVHLVSPYLGLTSSLEQQILPDDKIAGWNIIEYPGGAGAEYNNSFNVPEFHADYCWVSVSHNDVAARNVGMQIIAPAGQGVFVAAALNWPASMQFSYGPVWVPSGCHLGTRVQGIVGPAIQTTRVLYIRVPIGAV